MKTLAENKKGLFNYKILESWEAGLVLLGAEVKSCRKNNLNLTGSYVSLENSEFFLRNAYIAPYQEKNQPGYDPYRSRKLLLTQKEINELIGKSKQKGLTIIAIKVYTKGGFIKIQIGLAQGKKKHDKRELIKKRDIDRQISRILKEQG